MNVIAKLFLINDFHSHQPPLKKLSEISEKNYLVNDCTKNSGIAMILLSEIEILMDIKVRII